MSTFKCEVVDVKLEPHPNADSLSLVRIGGYTVVVRTSEWKGLIRGVYIPPDSVVPYNDRFAFLGPQEKDRRIRVRRLRGVYSQGLLLPFGPEEAEFDLFDPNLLGMDMAERWGITHYEPPVPEANTGGQVVAGPPGLVIPRYDVENFARFPDIIQDGDQVVITEKIHGCNARYVCVDGQMYYGSRSEWKSPDSLWGKAVAQNSWIETWCRANEGSVLFGEVYGWVQSLRYGASPGQYFFNAFDILMAGSWLSYPYFIGSIHEVADHNCVCVPFVAIGDFDSKDALALAEGDSSICPGQCREGVVIRTLKEQSHPLIGRCQLKMISNRYLEKA